MEDHIFMSSAIKSWPAFIAAVQQTLFIIYQIVRALRILYLYPYYGSMIIQLYRTWYGGLMRDFYDIFVRTVQHVCT